MGTPVTSPDEVLEFWFGRSGTPEHGTARAVWFTRSATFDESIRSRFGTLHDAAVSGGLVDWEGAPRSALALILVLDQFSRNLHRDTARAFAGDARALGLARSMVARGSDRELPPLERQFVYMPFEHAEDLAMQDEALRLFRELEAESSLKDLVRWAAAHHRIIARFGRFPHRNAALGRASTPEEIAFLREPESSF